MWYVKDEFSKKIYFQSNDVRETQNYAVRYNKCHKFSGQRMFRFVINDGVAGYFLKTQVDVNAFCLRLSFFVKSKYTHPFAVKGYHNRHVRYLTDKVNLIQKLCKKYHLWSYNGQGRKADGFDL